MTDSLLPMNAPIKALPSDHACDELPSWSDTTELIPVASDHWGMRVDAFLALCQKDHSRTQWQTLVSQGGVRLWPSGALPNKKERLDESITGVVVDHSFWPQSTSSLAPCAMNLKVYYDDPDIAVIEKPAGLVVHPGHGTQDTPTLVHGLLAHWEELSACGGSHKPGLVHRLDKETSGLLIVAKHDKAHRLLNQAFADRQVIKKYWAFVWGRPHPHFGRIHTNIGRHPTMRTHQAVIHGPGGREAITTYRVVRHNDTMSVLECGLLTGRTHQIRVHCAHIGHPVVGDAMYGKKKPWPRHGLHAHCLEFTHPISLGRMTFHSPLPEDLQALWDTMSS